MVRMNPGKMNRRIVMQVRTVSKDATGSRVETWADSATVWAEAVTQKGNEGTLADADRFQDSRQFRIRYRSLDPSNNRILYQSKFYNIKGITEEGIQTGLLIDAIATQSIT